MEGARVLIAFWRQSHAFDNGESAPLHDFYDNARDTQFLGDLYQDLSEPARKKYALLQTPRFVIDLILDLTLERAIEEFGLDPEPPDVCPEHLKLPRGLRTIDPACGSGHFLLRTFYRLVERLRNHHYEDEWDLLHRALYSVHGVDKNPFAVAITRFRLLIAAMQESGTKALCDAPAFTLNIAVGDSLLHGRGGPDLDQGEINILRSGELLEAEPVFMFSTETINQYIKTVDLLGVSSYHVVFGNPPYITVKDRKENRNYRYYKSCSGAYALSVPFTERFFQLAIRARENRRQSGFVGQIAANSFMKREFGRKLIEEYFRTIRLTHLIDTSGAYIPGHSTPTVILIGRRVYPRNEPIRAVLGIRGEPRQPIDAASGHVWSAIIKQINSPGSESVWLSVCDVRPNSFLKHPMSLAGGGTPVLVSALEDGKNEVLGARVQLIGRTAHTGSDDVYLAEPGTWTRQRLQNTSIIALVEGDSIRDWSAVAASESIFPYDSELMASIEDKSAAQHLWVHRTALRGRREPGGTHEQIGLTWYEWSRWHPERFRTRVGIAMSFVATHPNFALTNRPQVYKQSAPVIKLPADSSAEDYLELLGILNSSGVCFWLKQACQKKGGANNSGGGRAGQPWSWSYEFTSTKLLGCPLPALFPISQTRTLDQLAQIRSTMTPRKVCAISSPSREGLDLAQTQDNIITCRMIGLQEELDWEVYRLYGLLSEEEAAGLVADPGVVPGVALGERAFEIVLARRVAAGEVETQWFARHGSTPITEVPAHWPEAYRRVVEKRIETIEKRPQTIGLIERPEYKRRWATEPWEKKEKAALRGWLLDRCEARELWFAADDDGGEWPRPMTVGRLADRLRNDADFVSVARLYAGEDADVLDVLVEIVGTEHVPFLAAWRYKESGLQKRAKWERTWDLQRREDETGERLDIPVPPKYASTDFTKVSYWRNRGKLDVPKERLILQPHLEISV